MKHYQKITVVFDIDKKCGLPESNVSDLKNIFSSLSAELHATFEIDLE